jgi:hypothetical protein
VKVRAARADGGELLGYALAGAKLFTSTNQSNTAMQRLLVSLG